MFQKQALIELVLRSVAWNELVCSLGITPPPPRLLANS